MNSPTSLTSSLKAVISSCAAGTFQDSEMMMEDSQKRTMQRNIESLYQQLKREPSLLQLMSDENLLASECVMAIITVMGRVDSDDVLLSTLKLLRLLASERVVKEQLLSFGLTDSLVKMLDKEDFRTEIMAVLQVLTYQTNISGHEAFLEKLLPIAVNIVLNKESAMRQSLSVLVNLCAENQVVKQQVRGLDRTLSLRRVIRCLIGHDDNEVVIVALAAMVTTGMADEVNKMVSNEKNLDQILKLPFSIILTLRKKESFYYAIDVLRHLVKIKKVQVFLLSNYSHAESFLSKMASLLTKCSSSQLPKLFELLLALCEVAGLRRLLTTIVFAPIKIAQSEEAELLVHIFELCKRSVVTHNNTSVGAIKFIRCVYEALIAEPTLAGSTCHLEFQFLTECLKQNELDSRRKEIACLSAEKLNTALRLLELLCGVDTMRSAVLSEVETTTITDIIDYQLRNNPVCLKVSAVISSDSMKTKPWSSVGVEIVLRSLNILMKATEHNSCFESCLENYLQRSTVIPFIAAGLTSPLSEQVLLALKITKVHMFPLTVLADVISGLSQQNTAPPKLSALFPPEPALPFVNSDMIAAASPFVKSEKITADVIPGSPPSISEKLNNIHLTDDSHTSDIISIYEQKLRAQKTKEIHLDDLVQAKSMALAQADRLILQYKSRLAQTDSEAQKLRSIVLESERRSESYREKMNEMLIDQERLQREMEKYLEDAQRLENAQRTLASLKDEHKTLKDMHGTLATYTENLKLQHHELESEYDLLKETDRKKTLTIKEQEAKLADMNKIKTKVEEQARKLSQEKAELLDQVSKLKEDKDYLQKTVKSKDEKLKIISELTSGAK